MTGTQDTSHSQPTSQPGHCRHSFCAEPAWEGDGEGFCLYHSASNGRDDESAGQVWLKARAMLSAGAAADFSHWHFPPCPENIGFEDVRFPAVTFERASFESADFTAAQFTGPAVFSGARFSEAASFARCRFADEATFHGAHFTGLADFDAVCFDGQAEFGAARFDSTVNFSGAVFAAEALFTAARVDGMADFDQARFEIASFGRAEFGLATFRHADFHSHAYFRGADFVEADFRGASFADIEFGDVRIGKDVLFSEPSGPWPFVPSRPFAQVEQGEVAYRLAKQAAQGRGDYRAAGEYHYAEQRAIGFGHQRQSTWRPWRAEFWRRPTNALWCLAGFLFAHCLFGYGERPSRVLFAGLVVIVGWALLYTAVAGIGPGECTGGRLLAYQPDFRECLHFSAVTFTTLGYGDLKPKPQCRLLADSEAFLGAAILSMFVVALTRKYMR